MENEFKKITIELCLFMIGSLSITCYEVLLFGLTITNIL